MQNALLFERRGFGLGVMGAQNLYLSRFWLASPLRQHDPKRRIIPPPRPLKPNHQHVEKYRRKRYGAQLDIEISMMHKLCRETLTEGGLDGHCYAKDDCEISSFALGGVLYAAGVAGLLAFNPLASVAPWLVLQTIGAIAVFKIIGISHI